MATAKQEGTRGPWSGSAVESAFATKSSNGAGNVPDPKASASSSASSSSASSSSASSSSSSSSSSAAATPGGDAGALIMPERIFDGRPFGPEWDPEPGTPFTREKLRDRAKATVAQVQEKISKLPGSNLTGYMPLRADFDVEHDNEAEVGWAWVGQGG